jgi:hypothetical protein
MIAEFALKHPFAFTALLVAAFLLVGWASERYGRTGE